MLTASYGQNSIYFTCFCAQRPTPPFLRSPFFDGGGFSISSELYYTEFEILLHNLHVNLSDHAFASPDSTHGMRASA